MVAGLSKEHWSLALVVVVVVVTPTQNCHFLLFLFLKTGGIENCETTESNPIYVWEFPSVDINTEVVCTLACSGTSTTIVLGGEIATSRDEFSNSMDSDNDGKISNSKDDNSGDSTDTIKDDDKGVVTGGCPLTITLKADATGNTYCAAYDTSGFIASGSLTCSSCAAAGTATTFGSGLRNFLGGDW